MSKKDLQKDYGIVDKIDENGKISSEIIYRGFYYAPTDARAIKRAKVLTPIFAVIALIAYLIPLILVNKAARTIYFIIPYIGQIFPIFFLFGVCCDLLFKKPPYKEKEKRSIAERSKVLCVIGGIMAAASLISFVVFWAAEGAKAADFSALVGAAFCAVSFVAIFLIIYKVTLVRVSPTGKTVEKNEE